jgi:hypothetical protein
MRKSPDRLLLDEMFSPQIAALLFESGIDCLSVASDPTLRAQDDVALADAAVTQGRTLVTTNVVDVERIRRDRLVLGRLTPPVICTDDSTFPRRKGWVEQVAAALAYAATEHLTASHGGVLWLSRAPVD